MANDGDGEYVKARTKKVMKIKVRRKRNRRSVMHEQRANHANGNHQTK